MNWPIAASAGRSRLLRWQLQEQNCALQVQHVVMPAQGGRVALWTPVWRSQKKIRGVKKLGPRSSEQDFLGFSFMSVHYLITCCQEKFYKTYKLKKVTKLKSREEARPEERSER